VVQSASDERHGAAAHERDLKIAIAHDWLVSYAGSERVLDEILAEFPGSRILTAVLVASQVPPRLATAEPSFLQRVPGAPTHHELLLPLLPLAWAARPAISGVDVVVSSSHSCAKAVRIAPGIPHVCYSHTPMRYAWYFDDERDRLPRLLQIPARPAMSVLRRWDASTAQRVSCFLANSSAVAERIRSFYGRTARVVHPPVRTDFYTPADTERRRFLYVGRLVSYKRADVVVEAFRGLPFELTVVGGGHQENALRRSAPPNVVFEKGVTDERLRELYRTSYALVYPGVEDFGIAMAEAQACGTPVIAAAAGGALDIVEPEVTGWLLREPTIDSLRAAIRSAVKTPFPASVVSAASARFSVSRFRSEIRDAVEQAARP
jgi:glycosyltransferase involved in cell wall biosynthesis